MEYRVIKINELDKANELYRYVIKFCKTWDWNENYPSLKMIEEDILNHQLVGLFDNNQLIAISFIGCRQNPDCVKGWKTNLKKPARWARICVHPQYQRKGIGKLFINLIIKDLKSKGYDGIRIIVAKENFAALNLYKKFKFNCVAEHFQNSIEWWCLEKEI